MHHDAFVKYFGSFPFLTTSLSNYLSISCTFFVITFLSIDSTRPRKKRKKKEGRNKGEYWKSISMFIFLSFGCKNKRDMQLWVKNIVIWYFCLWFSYCKISIVENKFFFQISSSTFQVVIETSTPLCLYCNSGNLRTFYCECDVHFCILKL